MKIIPTVFARNKKEFKERFEKLLSVSDFLQIDFMDGKFVKSKSVLLSSVPDLKKDGKKFEAHLMVKNPISWVGRLKEKGFSKVIFHLESYKNEKMIRKTIALVRERGMEVWIALNPETSVEKVEEFLEVVDGVLFMGVKPGREHQDFVDSVFGKIKDFRRKHDGAKVQVDGGVNLEVIKKLSRCGADIVNSGSFVSDSEYPKRALRELQDAGK